MSRDEYRRVQRAAAASMAEQGYAVECQGRVYAPGAGSVSRGFFARYDDDGLRTALADPELRGRNRRQAERVAASRGLSS